MSATIDSSPAPPADSTPASPADRTPATSAGRTILDDVLKAVSQSVERRGYLTTEFWTTLFGGALSVILAFVHVSASTAAQVAAVAAPALLAGTYAAVRTMHKSALASLLGDLFPQDSESPTNRTQPE